MTFRNGSLVGFVPGVLVGLLFHGLLFVGFIIAIVVSLIAMWRAIK